jgi:nucleoside-diphosphate-sugar epimerase
VQRAKSNCQWITQRIPSDSTCIHLAGLSDLNSAAIDPEKAIRDARSLALDLMDMNFSNVIFASSAAVYGDKQTKPHGEVDPVVLDHPYARVKWETENVLLKGGATVVRLANVYGPGMAKNNIFSDILNQLSLGTSAISIRDGSCVRDFVHVQDIIDGLVRLVRAPRSGVFNLGSGVGTKTGTVARMVLDLAGQTTRRVVSLNSNDSTSCIVLDSSIMTKTYQWRPCKSLEDGIVDILTTYQMRSM